MYQTTKKRASGPKCPVTGKRIQGVCQLFRAMTCFHDFLILIFMFLCVVIMDFVIVFLEVEGRWRSLIRASHVFKLSIIVYYIWFLGIKLF